MTNARSNPGRQALQVQIVSRSYPGLVTSIVTICLLSAVLLPAAVIILVKNQKDVARLEAIIARGEVLRREKDAPALAKEAEQQLAVFHENLRRRDANDLQRPEREPNDGDRVVLLSMWIDFQFLTLNRNRGSVSYTKTFEGRTIWYLIALLDESSDRKDRNAAQDLKKAIFRVSAGLTKSGTEPRPEEIENVERGLRSLDGILRSLSN